MYTGYSNSAAAEPALNSNLCDNFSIVSEFIKTMYGLMIRRSKSSHSFIIHDFPFRIPHSNYCLFTFCDLIAIMTAQVLQAASAGVDFGLKSKTDPDLSNKMKDALRRHAKAVVVISCRHNDTRYAMAATASVELSLDPPSLLICINKSASIHEPLTNGASKFCVSILNSSQQTIAGVCSGKLKGEARFAEGNWADNDEGTPYISDAQANFFCELDGSLAYGTHVAFVGAIKAINVTGEVDPLVYANGHYTLLRSA